MSQKKNRNKKKKMSILEMLNGILTVEKIVNLIQRIFESM